MAKNTINGGFCPKQIQIMGIVIILYTKNQKFKEYSQNMAA